MDDSSSAGRIIATMRAICSAAILLSVLWLTAVPARAARAQTAEPPASTESKPPADGAVNIVDKTQPTMTLDMFLDRLMMSESGGRANARNPLSTAVGPFQFIASTWLHIARTSFATETADLKPHEVLDLRTDPKFARRAAKIYTEENAAHLVANGHQATFANLRLAHLVGAGGAVKILSAKSGDLVATLLGATVVGANPFMRAMTAEGLIARSARDIAIIARLDQGETLDAGIVPSGDAIERAKKKPRRAEPRIDVDCSLARPSCRRWLALAKRKLQRVRRASR